MQEARQPAAPSTADLNVVSWQALQGLCRNGGVYATTTGKHYDFRGLGLTRGQWEACLRAGTGCTEGMLEAIRLEAALATTQGAFARDIAVPADAPQIPADATLLPPLLDSADERDEAVIRATRRCNETKAAAVQATKDAYLTERAKHLSLDLSKCVLQQQQQLRDVVAKVFLRSCVKADAGVEEFCRVYQSLCSKGLRQGRARRAALRFIRAEGYDGDTDAVAVAASKTLLGILLHRRDDDGTGMMALAVAGLNYDRDLAQWQRHTDCFAHVLESINCHGNAVKRRINANAETLGIPASYMPQQQVQSPTAALVGLLEAEGSQLAPSLLRSQRRQWRQAADRALESAKRCYYHVKGTSGLHDTCRRTLNTLSQQTYGGDCKSVCLCHGVNTCNTSGGVLAAHLWQLRTGDMHLLQTCNACNNTYNTDKIKWFRLDVSDLERLGRQSGGEVAYLVVGVSDTPVTSGTMTVV